MPKDHVFLSYCHENKAEVRQLRKELLDAGETVWWDEDISPGQDWEFAIREALKNSYAVVFCFSEETEARYKSGIYPELYVAIELFREFVPGSIFILPVRLSECKIPLVKIHTNLYLDGLQHVDLFPPSAYAEGVARLVGAIWASPEHP